MSHRTCSQLSLMHMPTKVLLFNLRCSCASAWSCGSQRGTSQLRVD
jgi:hypothetical protein